MKYNKLVRDKIPEIIKEKGKIPITHIANDSEYSKKLKSKLKEEIEEFIETPSEEELADILEVIDAIIENESYDKTKLEKLKKDKVEERGKFKDKIILDEVK